MWGARQITVLAWWQAGRPRRMFCAGPDHVMSYTTRLSVVMGSGCRLHDRRLLKPCAVEITELNGYTIMKRSAGLLILGICSMPVLAHTPVIDCKAASGAVEKLICSDPSLSALDQKMAQIYQAAVAKGTDPAWLKATQRGWIKGRNECWKSSDLAACTRHNYQLRIAELQVKYQLSQPLAPIEYRCHGRPDPVTVTFYNETKPKAANITLDSSSEANSTYSNSTHSNSQVVSFIQPSGSGFRYGGVNTQYDVLLWGKGNDATLTINGTEYACQVIARPKDSSKTDEPTETEKTPQDNSKSGSRIASKVELKVESKVDSKLDSKVDSKVPKAEQPAGQ